LLPLGALIDTKQVTVGFVVGYSVKAMLLILVGAVFAWVNTDVNNRLAVLQLGIAAPALITASQVVQL
jgi:hypothetical protein